MRVRIVGDKELPGGFMIESETAAETLMLRNFNADKRPIYIANRGPSRGTRWSMLIVHQPQDWEDEKDNVDYDERCEARGPYVCTGAYTNNGIPKCVYQRAHCTLRPDHDGPHLAPNDTTWTD